MMACTSDSKEQLNQSHHGKDGEHETSKGKLILTVR
jgi:hypothetical protein